MILNWIFKNAATKEVNKPNKSDRLGRGGEIMGMQPLLVFPDLKSEMLQ